MSSICFIVTCKIDALINAFLLLFIYQLPCDSEGREERIKALEATQQDKVIFCCCFVMFKRDQSQTSHYDINT